MSNYIFLVRIALKQPINHLQLSGKNQENKGLDFKIFLFIELVGDWGTLLVQGHPVTTH